jgi:hypothetical protein
VPDDYVPNPLPVDDSEDAEGEEGEGEVDAKGGGVLY